MWRKPGSRGGEPGHFHGRSLADNSIAWPGFEEVGHVLFLRDYNTRLVVLSTVLLGAGCGLIGFFCCCGSGR